MGVTKTALFSKAQNEMASAAKALAHPARVAIIQHLLSTNSCINSDLVQELGLAQATVSQHLRELRDIGIIQGRIEGARRNYFINPTRWTEIRVLFSDVFDRFEPPSPGDCC